MAWVITQRDREARIRALARAWPRDKVTRWKSRRHYGAVSNRKSARVVPRLHLPNLWRWSLLVKMTYGLNDILDDVIAHHQMDDVIMMSLGLYSNVWLGLIIIGTQIVEGLT